MYGRSGALSAYGRIASAETNPIQQIVMLYDGAIKFLRLAAADIEAADIAAKGEHTNRALDIISYLQSILDFEQGGEAAPTLDVLYASVTRLVMSASIKLDASEMRRAAELLAPVRDSWANNVAPSTSHALDVQATQDAAPQMPTRPARVSA